MADDACRCRVLNVLSGDLAVDYLTNHLGVSETDTSRRVHVCPTSGVQWIEDRSAPQYATSTRVLRRLA
ncbi:MAG: hypothetical protein WD360_02140 [Nitriliruptoraceae bacterium]